MITIDKARAEFSDLDLLSAATRLAAQGRLVTADLVALLAVLVERKLYAGEGYGSAHDFCVSRLLLSDAQAYHRLAAAQVAARFPQVLERLRDGRLSLTNLALLRPHLTEENAESALRWVEGRRKHEVERFLRGLSPLPDVATSLRRLPLTRGAAPLDRANDEPAAAVATATHANGERLSLDDQPPLTAGQLVPTPALAGNPDRIAETVRSADVRQPLASPHSLAPVSRPAACADSSPAEIRALAPTRFSLRVTISEETQRKLRQVQELLGHAVPKGDVAEVLDRALTVLLEQLERAKFAARKERARKPVAAPPRKTVRRSPKCASSNAPQEHRAGSPALPAGSSDSKGQDHEVTSGPRSRHIPAAVRRAVWVREGGRCSFVGPEGRCTRTRRLEFHHRVPFAEGGVSTVDNVSLRCRVHNELESVRWFGPEVASRWRGESEGVPARCLDFDQSKRTVSSGSRLQSLEFPLGTGRIE